MAPSAGLLTWAFIVLFGLCLPDTGFAPALLPTNYHVPPTPAPAATLPSAPALLLGFIWTFHPGPRTARARCWFWLGSAVSGLIAYLFYHLPPPFADTAVLLACALRLMLKAFWTEGLLDGSVRLHCRRWFGQLLGRYRGKLQRPNAMALSAALLTMAFIVLFGLYWLDTGPAPVGLLPANYHVPPTPRAPAATLPGALALLLGIFWTFHPGPRPARARWFWLGTAVPCFANVYHHLPPSAAVLLARALHLMLKPFWPVYSCVRGPAPLVLHSRRRYGQPLGTGCPRRFRERVRSHRPFTLLHLLVFWSLSTACAAELLCPGLPNITRYWSISPLGPLRHLPRCRWSLYTDAHYAKGRWASRPVYRGCYGDP
jgi:hypothetical protein